MPYRGNIAKQHVRLANRVHALFGLVRYTIRMKGGAVMSQSPVAAKPAESTTEHRKLARELVAQAHRADGLAPLDIERFHHDQAIAAANPFGEHIPQVALGIPMNWECVFDELNVSPDPWRFLNDTEWANGLIDAYNDKAERIVGRRILNRRGQADEQDTFPPYKQLHDIFEARNVWHGDSWWLQQSAHTEAELEALLDRVDRRLENLREFMLPPSWDERKGQLLSRGISPHLYKHQRGPVTFATSIYGAENLLYLIMLNPPLAARLRDTIVRAMLGMHEVLLGESEWDDPAATRGFSFCDDNCCLLNPEMYEFFGYPILKAVFDRCSPDPGDWRYQHSDSDMAHLLPILSRLDFSRVNFGPTLTVSQIREHMPRTVIEGQLAPFTFSRNEEVNIVGELLRDIEMAREKRGLLFATAGSVNNGSRLSGLRLIMAGIQKYGRIDD
ncbi:MAG: hypothetical protein GF331_20280 [Chitinivibrionales bacterium]|nr:hypothetical protein [Chitinivibrionales bacterium]